ncbi:MAG: phytanoyl-CoA dioxygenase family protein [Bacteroidetes bacterium]|nr:phytanoyl-CoA dioxygenase family protein [Bacteroidota bacterium]
MAGRLPEAVRQALLTLYGDTHRFSQPEGGVFYSVYSQDVSYRRKVHDAMGELLKPVYDSLFNHYRNLLNSFIVKVPGPKSEFSMHQDSTGLNELEHSPLSVWIPLQDTTVQNGCMCVVPKTHGLFSPYRGISISAPFARHEALVKKYLVPVEMKAGDILLFDNRIIHNSTANRSASDRVVVMSGVFPEQAQLISCFKDTALRPGDIEVIEQADSFLIEYPKFLNGCFDRPNTGVSRGFVKDVYGPLGEEALMMLLEQRGITPAKVPLFENTETVCELISEPVS